MKILNIDQIRKADVYTIKHEPISSHDLMERAALAFVMRFKQLYNAPRRVFIFCGKGNNGGDGLCIARLLYQQHYSPVVFIIDYTSSESPDFSINLKRLETLPIAIHRLNTRKYSWSLHSQDTLIIDAIFGSGLSRPIEGFTASIVHDINSSQAEVVAVDIPSGLYADKPSTAENAIIAARYTISFQVPKLCFMLPESYTYVGNWFVVNIKLHQQFLRNLNTPYYLLDNKLAMSLRKVPPKFTHKGTKGHSLFIGGSYGKIGAAILSCTAIMRVGAGLLTALVPKCGYLPLQTALPEAMVLTTQHDDYHNAVLPKLFTTYKAIAVGPGLGQHKATQQMLHDLLAAAQQPLVIDADALNIIALNNLWQYIPQHSILTPHPKEFERLAGRTSHQFEELAHLRILAQKHQLIIVLKRAHTAIALPNGQVYFNTTGNPLMGTAGSGDVLTGVIAGLLSQGYSPQHSALLGVYLHGKAGDLAAVGKTAITAMDIVENIDKI